MRVPPSTRPIHIFVYIIALLAHPSLGNCLHIPPSLRSVVNETFTLGGVRAKQGNTLNWMDWSSVMTSLPSHKILLLIQAMRLHNVCEDDKRVEEIE